jgi:hypothetical protein
MNELEKVLSVAKNEVGYCEKKSNSQLDDKTANAGDKNYTKYAKYLDDLKDFYNGRKNGYAWCDIFVDWCFVIAFGVERALELLCQPKKSCGAGVGYSCDYYKAKGQFYTDAQIGDQIFFQDGKGVRIHTGLVYNVDDKYVYTIEGNTSNKVQMKKYLKTSKSIYGYGRPKYKIEENKPVESKPVVHKITSKDFNARDYTFIKEKYVRRTPIVANNKIRYNDFVSTTRNKLKKDASGYAKTKIGASFYLSKFQDDYKGNVWGMYKGKYSNIWFCIYDSTGYQVK